MTIRPNQVLELIWIGWLISWIAASFWSARAQKRAATLENLDLPGCDDCGRYPARALDITVAGRETDLGSQLWGRGCSRGRDVGWPFADLVGAHLSRTVMVKRNHAQGRSTGPYALVRHPIYTGLIIALLATAAAEGRATALIGAAFVIFGVWLKARTEERFLMAELGAEIYGSYCRRVSMLIPSLPHRH